MPSKDIQFDSIPASIRKPGKYAEFNTKLAVRTLPANKQRMLIIGQRIAAGTVVEKIPTQVYSDKEAETYFGAGSVCHLMSRSAITANAYLDLTVIALDDNAAGVVATGTITITGPATSSGALSVYIANQKIDIAIAKDDTATEIAAAIVAAVTAKPDLPATAANVNGVVTLTAKNKGLCGNDIGLGYDLVNGSGVTVAIVAMASGATNPDIQDALDVVFAEQYDIIVTPFNNQTDITTLRDHLDAVGGPMEQRPGIGVYAMNGALSAATTLAGQVDHGSTQGKYLRYTSATKRKSMPYEIASGYAAVMAFEEDPARPLNALEIKGIAVPNIADRLSRNEQETCLNNGVSPLEVGPGERVQIVRAISTYAKDPQGIEDISLLDITTMRTLNYTRKAFVSRYSLRFPREKKSERVIKAVKTETLDVLYKLQELEILEHIDQWKDYVLVQDDLQDPNRLNVRIPADVVNGLHVLASRIDLFL